MEHDANDDFDPVRSDEDVDEDAPERGSRLWLLSLIVIIGFLVAFGPVFFFRRRSRWLADGVVFRVCDVLASLLDPFGLQMTHDDLRLVRQRVAQRIHRREDVAVSSGQAGERPVQIV
jgi:hypothetical protein